MHLDVKTRPVTRLAALSVLLLATTANAAVLAEYTFSATNYVSSDADVDSTASDLGVGSGLPALGIDASQGSPAPCISTSLSMSYTAADIAGSISGNDYYTFTVTPEAGKQITYTQLSLYLYKINGGADVFVSALSSFDGFTDANVISTSTALSNIGAFEQRTLDLSSMTSNIAAAVEFRVYLTCSGSQNALRLDEITLEGVVSDAPVDNDPPSPSTMTFAVAPYATGEHSISMSATTATDALNAVQYYFAETSGNYGGSDSGWQSDTNYTDTGLSLNTEYSYTVQARDVSPNLNTNVASAVASVTTDDGGYIAFYPFDTTNNYSSLDGEGATVAGDMTTGPGVALDWDAEALYFQRGTGAAGVDLAAAMVNEDYFAFAITPESGTAVTYTNLSAQINLSNGNDVEAAVLSSEDGFAAPIDTIRFPNGTRTLNFDLASLNTDVSDPVDFRIYFYSPDGGSSHDMWLDRIVLQGIVTPPPAGTIIVIR